MASSLKGPGIVAEGQDIFSTSSTASTQLGAYAETADGRGFRYVQASGVALVPGKLYQASAEDTTNLQGLGISAAVSAAGTSLTTGSTVTLSANQVAGGFLVITKGTGAGYTYKIKSNTAASSATATFVLEDPLIAALDTTSVVDIQLNPYQGVIVDPTTATSCPVGVAVYPVSATWYGWLQTHGPVGVLAQGTVGVGNYVIAANSTNAGAVSANATGTAALVGFALTGIASTEYGQVFLTID